MIKENEYSIAIAFTGHDASITIAREYEILEVMELERYFNSKNFDFSIRKWKNTKGKFFYFDTQTATVLLDSISQYIKSKYTDTFEYGIIVERDFVVFENETTKFDFKKFFNVKKWKSIEHHKAHAYGAFYQSPYQESLTISFDGGSKEGCLNVFYMKRDIGIVEKLSSFPNNSRFNYSKRYYRYGNLFGDIKLCDFNGSQIYPGKIMGLAGYGKSNHMFKQIIKEHLQFFRHDLLPLCINEETYNKMFQSDKSEKKNFDSITKQERFFGKDQFDVAASLQESFEDLFIENILPLAKKYSHLPMCFTGGCALNIMLNTKLVDKFNIQLFVPPDPSDCGLSHGAMLSHIKTKTSSNTAYLGSQLLDLDNLSDMLYDHISDFLFYTNIDENLNLIANHIAKGKIIGIVRGKSEIGPRALGNRSIVCSVAIPDMKDTINAKVKNREWYRPFSPVIRAESVSKYFYWKTEIQYMSFCPKVKDEYLEKIKPIVHVDNTARVQTITQDQNKFLYNLLGEVEKTTGYDMLLNTSFNVDSKPIVNNVKDVFFMLKNTQMDGVVIENILILKKDKS
jgi:carbamoyltransferase